MQMGRALKQTNQGSSLSNPETRMARTSAKHRPRNARQRWRLKGKKREVQGGLPGLRSRIETWPKSI
jgi:hypothetical protein